MNISELNNEVAIIFGRFNPPHKGHRAAWELASQSPHWYVGTNKSTQGPKDPLPYDVKIKAMITVWPEVDKHIVAEISWLTLASWVYKKHGNVKLLCLTDEDWVTQTIQKYNGQEGNHGYYKFISIEQKPTPRLSSATALRDAVINNDRKAFTKAAGISADTEVAGTPFFDLVAKYLLPYQGKPNKTKKKEKVEEKIFKKEEIYPTNYWFPDGRVWISDHIKKRIKDRELDPVLLNKIVNYARDRYQQELKDMDFVNFVIRRRSDRFGIAFAKENNIDGIRYIAVTAHATLKAGEDQPILYVESFNKDDLNIQIHKELNPAIFENNKMKSDVKEILLKIAKDFTDFLGIDIPGLKDITISGSNAAYNYTPSSDIDLHLVVDLPKADKDKTYRELFDAKKFQYNAQHNYKIHGYDVELYVQNANEKHISQGIYSILHDQWNKEPQHIDVEIDESAVKAKYDLIRNLIGKAIKSKNYDLADKLRRTIKKYRAAGLYENGEFGPENLAFKALRTKGYIKKLYDFLNLLKDKEFSLESSEQRLTEIDMSPGALKKFSASNIAKSTSVGFEFEMIVPNMVDDYGGDSEPDYDMDGYVESNTVGAMQRDLINFFRETSTTRQVERAVEDFSDRLNEFISNQFDEWLADNQDMLYEMYRDWTNLETEEEIKASIDDEDADYDRVIEKMRDQHMSEWDDLDGALEDNDLQMYSDWAREYDFDWPHYTETSSGEIDDDALKEVAQEIKNAVGMPVKSAAGYHAFKSNREPGVWYLETDSSIDADEVAGEGGLELVSPPLPLEQALEKLDQVLEWMQNHGAYTDSSTGFHMGVSIPEMENVDYIKLILFLGDKYVLEEFGRLGNSYTRSALSKMELGNAPHVIRTMPGIFDALKGGLEKAALKMLAASLVPINDKYTSVNIKDQYVEFRSAGGDYLEAIEKIKNTLLRYVRVMAIAADPNDAKQEYAKKLYKLLATAAANEKDLDVIKWFTMYSSGNIAKAELVTRLKQAQARRKVLKVLDTSWTLLGMYDRPVTVVQAKTQEEAWAKGREWEKSNPVNGGLRGIRQSTEDDIKQLTAASSEPAGPWQRWIVYGTGDDGRNVRLTAVSARDRQEASRLAFRWGRDNNRVVTGLNPEDEDLVDIANIYHRNESKRLTSLLDYIAETDSTFEYNHNFNNLLKEFIKFACEKLDIGNLPKIVRGVTPNSFGHYDIQNNTLSITTLNRHPMDALRTIAHELVHHKQNEDGNLEGHPDEGSNGSDFENEANSKAGVIMREFGKLHPEYFDLDSLNESKIW